MLRHRSIHGKCYIAILILKVSNECEKVNFATNHLNTKCITEDLRQLVNNNIH